MFWWMEIKKMDQLKLSWISFTEEVVIKIKIYIFKYQRDTNFVICIWPRERIHVGMVEMYKIGHTRNWSASQVQDFGLYCCTSI